MAIDEVIKGLEALDGRQQQAREGADPVEVHPDVIGDSSSHHAPQAARFLPASSENGTNIVEGVNLRVRNDFNKQGLEGTPAPDGAQGSEERNVSVPVAQTPFMDPSCILADVELDENLNVLDKPSNSAERHENFVAGSLDPPVNNSEFSSYTSPNVTELTPGIQAKRKQKTSKANQCCHLCQRKPAGGLPHLLCANFEKAKSEKCKKTICRWCLHKPGITWKGKDEHVRAYASGAKVLCPHCAQSCPENAQCFRNHRAKKRKSNSGERNVAQARRPVTNAPENEAQVQPTGEHDNPGGAAALFAKSLETDREMSQYMDDVPLAKYRNVAELSGPISSIGDLTSDQALPAYLPDHGMGLDADLDDILFGDSEELRRRANDFDKMMAGQFSPVTLPANSPSQEKVGGLREFHLQDSAQGNAAAESLPYQSSADGDPSLFSPEPEQFTQASSTRQASIFATASPSVSDAVFVADGSPMKVAAPKINIPNWPKSRKTYKPNKNKPKYHTIAPRPSQSCHLCQRKPKPNLQHLPCKNLNLYNCRKAICWGCLTDTSVKWEGKAAHLEAYSSGAEVECPHCLHSCPPNALCSRYGQLNQIRSNVRKRKAAAAAAAAAASSSDATTPEVANQAAPPSGNMVFGFRRF